MRTFAIGDVHGCLAALTALDRELSFGADDTVVMLGDYVDRGPDSKGVIDFLLALRERCHLVTLRGNHEVLMLEARHNIAARTSWLQFGGIQTLDSYGAKTLHDIPAEHWDFLEATIRFHERENEFFVHAGVDPGVPLSEQTDDSLFWTRFIDPQPHGGGKRMICGHTAQKSGQPDNRGHAVCIDTFVYGDGWLTCLDVETNRYWQANQSGETRCGGEL